MAGAREVVNLAGVTAPAFASVHPAEGLCIPATAASDGPGHLMLQCGVSCKNFERRTREVACLARQGLVRENLGATVLRDVALHPFDGEPIRIKGRGGDGGEDLSRVDVVN